MLRCNLIIGRNKITKFTQDRDTSDLTIPRLDMDEDFHEGGRFRILHPREHNDSTAKRKANSVICMDTSYVVLEKRRRIN